MVRIRSGIAVTGIVAAALVTVAVLTAQASDVPLRVPAPVAAAHPRSGPVGLPPDSGTGERVVYSVGLHRVWLTDTRGRVVRTYRVVAGEIAPSLGTHRVFARRSHGQGEDGADIEHVVMFATHGDDNVGFSAVALRAGVGGDPHRLRGAIREARADAAVLWKRAIIGAVVQVVP